MIEALRGTRVVAIAMDSNYNTVLTDGGEVLSFGRGRHGAIFHGNKQIQLKPAKLMHGALHGRRVVAIAVGGDCRRIIAQLDDGTVIASSFREDTHDTKALPPNDTQNTYDRASGPFHVLSTQTVTIPGSVS